LSSLHLVRTALLASGTVLLLAAPLPAQAVTAKHKGSTLVVTGTDASEDVTFSNALLPSGDAAARAATRS
jgi:hypothetical protein